MKADYKAEHFTYIQNLCNETKYIKLYFYFLLGLREATIGSQAPDPEQAYDPGDFLQGAGHPPVPQYVPDRVS